MTEQPLDPMCLSDTFVERMLPPEHFAGMVRLTFVASRIEGQARVPFVVSRMVMSADAYEAYRLAIWADRPGERESARLAECRGTC